MTAIFVFLWQSRLNVARRVAVVQRLALSHELETCSKLRINNVSSVLEGDSCIDQYKCMDGMDEEKRENRNLASGLRLACIRSSTAWSGVLRPLLRLCRSE